MPLSAQCFHALCEGAGLFILRAGSHKLRTGDKVLVSGGKCKGLDAPNVGVRGHIVDLVGVCIHLNIGKEGRYLSVAGEGFGEAVACGGQPVQKIHVGGLIHIIVEALLHPIGILAQNAVCLTLVVADLVDHEGIHTGIVQIIGHAAVGEVIGQTISAEAILQQEVVVNSVEIPVLHVVHVVVLIRSNDGPIPQTDRRLERGFLGKREAPDVDIDVGGLYVLAGCSILDVQRCSIETCRLLHLCPNLDDKALRIATLHIHSALQRRQRIGKHLAVDVDVMLTQHLGSQRMAVAVRESGEGHVKGTVIFGG